MPYNIIFYFTDQQRWDTCGCFGQPLDITPNLDRLAEEGINISLMTNKSRNEYAYTMIDVDAAVPAEVENKISEVDGVLRVRIL